jgi:hypothetical protein
VNLQNARCNDKDSFLMLLKERTKIRISSLWGHLWTRDLLIFGHNVRTLQLVSTVPPKYWYSPTALNTVTTHQTTPNLKLRKNVQRCIILVKIGARYGESLWAITSVSKPGGVETFRNHPDRPRNQLGKGAHSWVYMDRGLRLTNTRPPKPTHV